MQTSADLLSEWRVKSNFVEPWLRFGKLEQARFALTLHKVWRVEMSAGDIMHGLIR